MADAMRSVLLPAENQFKRLRLQRALLLGHSPCCGAELLWIKYEYLRYCKWLNHSY